MIWPLQTTSSDLKCRTFVWDLSRQHGFLLTFSHTCWTYFSLLKIFYGSKASCVNAWSSTCRNIGRAWTSRRGMHGKSLDDLRNPLEGNSGALNFSPCSLCCLNTTKMKLSSLPSAPAIVFSTNSHHSKSSTTTNEATKLWSKIFFPWKLISPRYISRLWIIDCLFYSSYI